MRTIRVNVTQRDIDATQAVRGVSGNGDRCAVARAVRRHKGLGQAVVGIISLYPYGNSLRGTFMPQSATDFIRRFDLKDPESFALEPFSFTFEVYE